MSIVNITNIQVLDNPARFTNPFQFDIVFECISPLKEDLECKIIYVGSAEDEKYDQVLDTIFVGPVPMGVNRFVFQADAPKPELIPAAEILGVTVVLITFSYKSQEFVRVGYYVNNEYDDPLLRENAPEQVQVERIMRNILADKPRVIKFPIKWDSTTDLDAVPPEAAEHLDEDDEDIVNFSEDEAGEEGDGEEGEDNEDEEDEEDDEDDDEDFDVNKEYDLEEVEERERERERERALVRSAKNTDVDVGFGRPAMVEDLGDSARHRSVTSSSRSTRDVSLMDHDQGPDHALECASTNMEISAEA